MSTAWVNGGKGQPCPGNVLSAATTLGSFPLNITDSNGGMDPSVGMRCDVINVDPTVAGNAYSELYELKCPLDIMAFLVFFGKEYKFSPGLTASGADGVLDRSDAAGIIGGPFVQQQMLTSQTSDIGITCGAPGNAFILIALGDSNAPGIVQFGLNFYKYVIYSERDTVNGYEYGLEPSTGNPGGNLDFCGYTIPVFVNDPAASPVFPKFSVKTPW